MLLEIKLVFIIYMENYLIAEVKSDIFRLHFMVTETNFRLD